MPYPEFYRAWHDRTIAPHPEVAETTAVGSTGLTQSLNLAELPRLVDAVIANSTHLSDKVKPIYIDNNFSNRDNPTLEVYAKIVKAGCPKCEDGRPKTMQELKIYWELDLSESELLAEKLGDRAPILLFYDHPATLPTGFSDAFLNNLSKFGDSRIGVVTSPRHSASDENRGGISASSGGAEWGSLQLFSPNQPNLIEDIVGWMRAIVMENE